jgi:hypothetical protein
MHSRRRNPKVLVAVYNTVSSVHSLSVWRSRKELLHDLDSGASRARVEHQNSSSESHRGGAFLFSDTCLKHERCGNGERSRPAPSNSSSVWTSRSECEPRKSPLVRHVSAMLSPVRGKARELSLARRGRRRVLPSEGSCSAGARQTPSSKHRPWPPQVTPFFNARTAG